jgi:hypothetical protein
MLFKQRFWAGIADGSIRLTFRRWKRAAAKVGSRHVVPGGSIEIDAVERTTPAAIQEADALAAGYADRDELLAALARYPGDLYRVSFHFAGDDPRVALRESLDDLDGILRRLERMDAGKPWTLQTLALIEEHPGTRAVELADMLGREKLPFKIDVRKLKALGLTESLPLGYRLSRRGQAVLDRVRR